MIPEGKIWEAARALGEAAKPAKVILFGSYATGEATEDSDLDFLVIEPVVKDRGAEMIRLQNILRPLEIEVDIDVLVYSEAEAEKRRGWCTTPVYWALREGKVMYDGSQ
jgi:predicted nucleotidyltransferase